MKDKRVVVNILMEVHIILGIVIKKDVNVCQEHREGNK